MIKRVSSGIFVIFLIPLLIFGADKSKKAYELIYKDVQILKQKIIQLEEKLENNAEDVKRIKGQFDELLNLVKLLQRDQASLQEDQKKIPAQYQVILEKMEGLNSQLVRLFGELIEIKRASITTSVQEQELESKLPEKETQAEEELPQTPLPSPSLSPQVVYNMAYTDYLKGNFQLAIEGFNLYREQFPNSPLSDNALYWIGECHFSLEEFERAIENFNELILNYPSGDKIAAAYLKKGISLMDLGKKEEALLVFKLLISKYPLEEETKIAQQKIKELLS
jgi:tol-pal system protein YbgF